MATYQKNDEYASSKKITALYVKKEKSLKTKMPQSITPMLATLVHDAFDDQGWIFEIKWDGYRSIAFVSEGKVQLKSRAKHLWNEKFPAIVKDLEHISGDVILDGELVVLDEEGRSHFQLMQNYQKSGQGVLCYYVFDLLYKDGQDLRERPLLERKEMLRELLEKYPLPHVHYNNHLAEKGVAFFKEAKKNHLEGIIGKKASGHYQSKRSREWVKIKTFNRQEVVIGGFTAPQGSRKKFGALLVGVYDDQKKLVYSGHVGGGFTVALLQDVYDQLHPLIQPESPFDIPPKPNAPVTWVKPCLVCEVSFTEWTEEDSMRHPVFQGLREDKSPLTVKREIPRSAPLRLSPANSKVALSHLDKIYWPQESYTKGDLIHYYEQVGSVILPYLKDRPIMLHRFPQGLGHEGFYQKDLEFDHPQWIKTFKVKHEERPIDYLLVNDLRSLVYAINLGCIDLHPFLAGCKHLEYPDYCVIDLDPHDIAFEHLITTALEIHEILDKSDITHHCKTSGSKGLHICIPLHAKYNFEQSRQFAEIIAHSIYQKLPDITSLEREVKKKQKKVYLDCLQNRFGQTLVSPYSVRPRPFAPISTPLLWEEVNKDLDINEFNIKTLPKRLQDLGDIFRPVLGRGIAMEACLKRLKKLL